MFKLDLDKAEEPKIKFPASTGSPKKAREFQKYIYYCFFDYAQVFDCVNHNKMQKILQFSHSVGSDSLWPHELQHARLPCPTGVVLHQLLEFTQTQVHWIGYAIWPSDPLSSPSPPAPNPSQHESFPMSQLFTWGGHSIEFSAFASVLQTNTQDQSPLGRTLLNRWKYQTPLPASWEICMQVKKQQF